MIIINTLLIYKTQPQGQQKILVTIRRGTQEPREHRGGGCKSGVGWGREIRGCFLEEMTTIREG